MSSKKRKLKKLQRSVLNKSHHEAKAMLIIQYGTRCWICGKDVNKGIQYHHIIPKYANGHPSDISNGSLLCATCHVEIHQHQYGTDEYQKSVDYLLDYKKQNKEVQEEGSVILP